MSVLFPGPGIGIFRKTKIIATLGPNTESSESIRALILAGADVFRLNMSHASPEWVRTVFIRIREVAAGLNCHIGVMMDTQGPEIRTGDLDSALELSPGDVFDFTVRGEKSEEVSSVDVNYEGMVNDIGIGDIVLVDNGVIRLEVLEKNSNRIRCRVLTHGILKSRRHINLPGVRVSLPPLTVKDKQDIQLAAELGFDFIALSFCREPSDVHTLRSFLKQHGSTANIIAKIEDQQAVRNLEGIIEASDSIMIARGDLGVECPMEELPIIQRRLIKQCIRIGKPVIVATHLLESMIQNPTPTRAEITDVANAVYEQADAIMLSGETAAGRYPVECVEIMDRVSRRIERSGGAGYATTNVLEGTNQLKTVRAAVVLANSLTNARILVFTRRGYMGHCTSNLRAERAPTFVFSPSQAVCRKLSLNWGLVPIQLEFEDNPGITVNNAIEKLRVLGHVKHGDNLVVVSDVLAAGGLIDSIQLRTVG